VDFATLVSEGTVAWPSILVGTAAEQSSQRLSAFRRSGPSRAAGISGIGGRVTSRLPHAGHPVRPQLAFAQCLPI
jgi:hypothetical protein